MSTKADFYNKGDAPIRVPGIGLPLTFEVITNDTFAHGLGDFNQDRLVAVEVAMLAVMDTITDKPDWQRKVFDELIVEKWRSEARAMPLISPKAWDWLLRELREKTEFFKRRGFITTLDSGSVCAKADGMIDGGLRDELIAGVGPLLAADDKAKDWHPNSNDQVLNLVHPSLFPLVYGRTQVLEKGRVGVSDCLDLCGQGMVPSQQSTTIEVDRRQTIKKDARFSSRFQWLPAEVRFKETNHVSGEPEVEITSYINNLHPTEHRDLYSTISKIIGKAIPMWNEVLVKDVRVPPRIKVWGAEDTTEIPEHLSSLAETDPEEEGFNEALEQVLEYLALPDRPGYDTSDDDENDERYKNGTWKNEDRLDEYALHEAVSWKYDRIREVAHPDVGEYISYEEWKQGESKKTKQRRRGHGRRDHERPIFHHNYYDVRLEEQFGDQGLQVIVKLASVELTPDKPTYNGGSWHLEGMMNEHIVATAIYYNDVENITESLIDFRTAAYLDSEELSYEQDEHQPLQQVFGVASLRDEPAIQQLGSLRCKEDRMLAFPNTLQHRVQPFGLLDPSRPGHRRFLVLWLVDPNYRIASTANVPPQQHHWVAPETIDKVLAKQCMAAELEDMIKEHTDDYPMNLDTAKKLRLELMKERTTVMPHVQRNNIGSYNFCEH